jgi:hypothetical protein
MGMSWGTLASSGLGRELAGGCGYGCRWYIQVEQMTLLQHRSLNESNASSSQRAQKKPLGKTPRSSALPLVSTR